MYASVRVVAFLVLVASIVSPALSTPIVYVIVPLNINVS